MARSTSTTEQVWADFRTLSPESRVAFLQLLVADDELREELEDAFDLAVIAERADEPTRPFSEVMDEIRARARVAVRDRGRSRRRA